MFSSSFRQSAWSVAAEEEEQRAKWKARVLSVSLKSCTNIGNSDVNYLQVYLLSTLLVLLHSFQIHIIFNFCVSSFLPLLKASYFVEPC